MNLGKLLRDASRIVKKNPELALMVVGLAAPSLAAKAVKVAAKAKVAHEVMK